METQVDDLIRKLSAPPNSPVQGIPYIKSFVRKQRFSILPQRLSEFFDELCEMCSEDESLEDDENPETFENYGLPFSEVVSKRTIPVIAMFKFSFNLTEAQREEPSLYDDSFTNQIIKTLQNVICEKINIGPSFSELLATFEESQPWTVNGVTYLTFKVQFPYCQVDVGYQRKKLRGYFIEALTANKVIDKMDIKPNHQDWNLILQEICESIPMYRCKFDQSSAPMKLTNIYHRDEEAEPQILELSLDIFNPQNHQHIRSNTTSSIFLGKEDVKLEYWIPIFLSIYFWSGEATVKEMEIVNGGLGEIEYDKDTVSSNDPLIIAKNLLPLLDVKRFNVEPFWRDVCQALYTITQGSDEGLQLFIQHSVKANVPGRDREACTTAYYQCSINGTTVKTIGWYAREDSPQQYEKWHQLWCESSIVEAMSCVHDDVAEAIYRFFWLDFMCSGLTKNSWYKFEENHLIVQDDAVDLKRAITNKLIPFYKDLRIEHSKKTQTGSDMEKKQSETYIGAIGKLVNKLGTQGFKTSVIKSAQEKFYIPNFEQYRDKDQNKTGWRNCVIVCCGNQAYPVNGKPEDYITMTTHNVYRKDLTWEHPLVVRLLHWLKQVFTDNDLLEYFMKDASSFLYGRNSEKLFRVWSGDGDNSKSMIVKLFQATLGMYCVDFPVSLLSGKVFNSSGPTPELAQAQGSRVGFVSEPEGNEQIREGAVKRYTGGDRFFARFLNQNGGSVDAMFKLVLMCNRIPEFTATSKALRNRLLYLPYLSSWVDNPPEDPQEQFRQRKFKKDPYFENQIPDLSQAFGWLMVQTFPKYKIEGLKAPPIVEQHTKMYWEENDPIKLFINEKLTRAYVDADKKEVDVNATLTASEIYPEFQRWYRQSYPGNEIPNLPTLRIDLTQHLGICGKGKRWVGIKFIQNIANI